MKAYASALTAVRVFIGGAVAEYSTKTSDGVSANEEEARKDAMALCRAEFPESDGFCRHAVVVDEIPRARLVELLAAVDA